MKCGGGSRTRTGDIRLAKPTLYQLSYAPIGAGGGVRQRFGLGWRIPVFRFGRRGGQALRAMCRRVGRPAADATGAKPDELTIGTPDCSGSVSLERR